MEHNNSLTLKARNLLCESLDTDPPTPDSMISAMATIDLPGTYSGVQTLWATLLTTNLLDEFSIQVPVFPWPHHKMRYFRISAYLYNAIEEYEYLAEILQDNL